MGLVFLYERLVSSKNYYFVNPNKCSVAGLLWIFKIGKKKFQKSMFRPRSINLIISRVTSVRCTFFFPQIRKTGSFMRFMSSFSLALKSQIKAIIFTIKATFVNFEPWQFLWFFQGEKTLTFRSKAVVISELRQIGLS